MSALGQKQTYAVQYVMSALPPIADMCGAKRDVRFVPIADIDVYSVIFHSLSDVRTSVALRVCVPWPFEMLIKIISLLYEPSFKVFALSRKVNVTVRGRAVAVPVVNDAFSQLGIPEIRKPISPPDDLSAYLKGVVSILPSFRICAEISVAGDTCRTGACA